MGNFISSFFSNDSKFGRLATRCGILIGANLMFLLFSIPIFTVGAALTGLYTTTLRLLRGDEELNPFKTFWKGFKDNFKQATLLWVGSLVLAAVLWLEIYWCQQFTGPVALFRYALIALLFALVILLTYLFPTLAAFQVTFSQLVLDGIYFAFSKPLKLIAMVLLTVVPIGVVYLDQVNQPLYAFVGVMCGFSAIAMLQSTLLLPLFQPHLDPVDAYGNILTPEEAAAGAAHQQSEAEILEDMKKLDL